MLNRPRRLSAQLLLLLLLPLSLAAQDKAPPTASPGSTADPKTRKALTIDDYSRWRQIADAQISSDGKWVSYITRVTNVAPADVKPVLHVLNLATNEDVTVNDVTNAEFSPDARWIVYQIETQPVARGRDSSADSSSANRPRGGAAGQPQRKTELRDLATGKTQSWQDIQTAVFSPSSTHLLLRRRPAGNQGAAAGGGGGGGGGFGGGQGGGSATVRATDALLHKLATAQSQFLGSVGTAEFNRTGTMLAYTVEAAVKDGNGLFVTELASGRIIPLDNDARTYNRTAWNDAGTSVAVLKGLEVPRMREKNNALLVVSNVGAPTQAATKLDSASATPIPKGFVVSDRAPLTWSDDNGRVFFGLIRQTTAPDTGRRKSTDSLANVDVWRTSDERIQSVQMTRADDDRNFSWRQAFDVKASKFIALADSAMKFLDVAPDGRWAVGRDIRGYVMDYGRDRADLYRVNTSTGERTLIMKAATLENFSLGISPDGKHYLYWKDGKFQDYNLDAGTSTTIGATAPSFINTEYDYFGDKPSYGVAGYTKDGRGVVVNGRYDLWYLPLAGSPGAPRSLTNGAGNRDSIRFRVARTVPSDPMAPRAQRDDDVIDITKPLTLSAYGDWTKKAGYYELNGASLRPVVYEDAFFTTPVRALKSDRFLFTRQTFAEFPDLRVSSAAFADSKKISNVNPQQSEYLWGHRILFDYNLKDGTRAQGILALPDDYKQGEKRPMLVTFYEKNSQNMHRYNTPSFAASMGSIPAEAVTKGYATMLPDVYFRLGQSHSDMLEAVEAATRKVIEMGYVDPKRIGVNGHSYGGEGAAFIGTRSRMFAAVGMGAGVTDLYSDFSQSWGWSYQVPGGNGGGGNGSDYYLYSQGRWGFSPWDKPDVYMFESALTHTPEVTQPFLIMHGTADPTVSFQEGMSFYQALRYNKKEAYLLAYPNEGHGLRGMANRRDLTVRYFDFFDHFLLGKPAPKWMTDGVPFLVKDAPKDPPPPRPVP